MSGNLGNPRWRQNGEEPRAWEACGGDGEPRAAAERLALWSLAFRPFFLAAAIWAALALALWIVLFMTGGRYRAASIRSPDPRHAVRLCTCGDCRLHADGDPQLDRPVADLGPPLAGLAALWLLGRIACLFSALLHSGWPAASRPFPSRSAPSPASGRAGMARAAIRRRRLHHSPGKHRKRREEI